MPRQSCEAIARYRKEGYLVPQFRLPESRINEGGVVFSNGIGQDFLNFNWGVEAEITIAQKQLKMVIA